jgi:hypothetical protein
MLNLVEHIVTTGLESVTACQFPEKLVFKSMHSFLMYSSKRGLFVAESMVDSGD